MKRTQIYLEEDQARRVETRAEARSTTKSALIREAIDEYLGEESEEDRLEAYRAAILATAGIAPYLPAGEEYVEELRRNDARRQEEIERRRRR